MAQKKKSQASSRKAKATATPLDNLGSLEPLGPRQERDRRKKKQLREITHDWDRDHFLLAHEVTPKALVEAQAPIKRVGWSFHKDRQLIVEKHWLVPGQRLKPILVPIVWQVHRDARRNGLNAVAGQLGVCTLEQVKGGDVGAIYGRLWAPREEPLDGQEWPDGYEWAGLTPASFKVWSQSGYIVDGYRLHTMPMLDEDGNLRDSPELRHWSHWVPGSMVRDSEGRMAIAGPVVIQRHQAKMVTRTNTKVARIIIPVPVIQTFVRMTRDYVDVQHKGMGREGLIVRAIKALEKHDQPIMSDTIQALCRLRTEKCPDVSYVQKTLKAKGYKKLAQVLHHGIYSRRSTLTKNELAWAGPEAGEESPA